MCLPASVWCPPSALLFFWSNFASLFLSFFSPLPVWFCCFSSFPLTSWWHCVWCFTLFLPLNALLNVIFPTVFLFAGAVLAKLDPQWGQQYKPHLYALIADYMSLNGSKFFPRLRCFDAFVLHSWAGGLVEFADGRNQESTSEAIHAYYAAALAGLAYKDRSLVDTGLTLAALESHSAQSLWHIPRGSVLYDPEFVDENRVVSVLWSTKRDSGLWFAGAERRDCRLGIQVLPITPVTEFIFTDKHFARELVNWAMPSLTRSDVTDGWRGFVYALQAIYEPQEALSKILRLNEHDDGNSLSNLLWWIYTR